MISDLVFARWAYAASGVPLDLDARLNDGRASVQRHFFDVSVPLAVAILGLFVAVLLGLVTVLCAARPGSAEPASVSVAV